MTIKAKEQAQGMKGQRLNFPRRMRTPGAWEIFSTDGRHGGTVSSQTPYRDIRARIDYLNQRDPDAGWTYEYIPANAAAASETGA